MNDTRLENMKLPAHLAIIMDGNGRWAKKHGRPRIAGHRAGMKSVRKTVEYCVENNIQVLTLYAFSTENWSRPGREVEFLMKLLRTFIKREIDELNEKKVKVCYIGDIDRLPEFAKAELLRGMEITSGNKGLMLNLALNYSGRSELIRVYNKLLKNGKTTITEQDVAENLDTAGQPDPDLMIRTSGEIRISNFMLWQLAYTELIFLDKFWPEIDKDDLFSAFCEFNRRNRRFGGLS